MHRTAILFSSCSCRCGYGFTSQDVSPCLPAATPTESFWRETFGEGGRCRRSATVYTLLPEPPAELAVGRKAARRLRFQNKFETSKRWTEIVAECGEGMEIELLARHQRRCLLCEDCSRMKFRSKSIYLAPFERKISSFGDAGGDGQYLDSDGNRVNVGNCSADGVNVNNNWDDNRNDNLGVAASRKSTSLL